MKFKMSVPTTDHWNGEDKVLHCALSITMAATATVSFNLAGLDSPALLGFAASMAVGVAKELKDAFTESGSGFSYKDLAADAVGSALGISVASVIISEVAK